MLNHGFILVLANNALTIPVASQIKIAINNFQVDEMVLLVFIFLFRQMHTAFVSNNIPNAQVRVFYNFSFPNFSGRVLSWSAE